MRPQTAAGADPGRGGQRPDRGRLEHERDDDGRQRDDRSDREVDSAGDDHHRHAERGRADDGGLPGDELEVVAAEELRSDEKAEDDGDEERGR